MIAVLKTSAIYVVLLTAFASAFAIMTGLMGFGLLGPLPVYLAPVIGLGLGVAFPGSVRLRTDDGGHTPFYRLVKWLGIVIAITAILFTVSLVVFFITRGAYGSTH